MSGAHSQAGSVDQAADVAVEGDVAEAELLGVQFVGVLLGRIEQLLELRMAVPSTLSSKLNLASIAMTSPAGVTVSGLISASRRPSPRRRRQPRHDVDRLLELVAFEIELRRQFGRLLRIETIDGMQRQLDDGIGVGFGDGFDLDAAFR